MNIEWLRSQITRAWALLKKACSRMMQKRLDVKIVDRALLRAEEHALSAEEDAVILECIMASGDPAQVLPSRLEMICRHAEELLQDARHLNAVEASGTHWQVQTIHFVRPLLRSLACQLDSLAHSPGTCPGFACPLPTVEYARGIATFAARTACLVHDILEWGHDGAKIDALQDHLMLPHQHGI